MRKFVNWFFGIPNLLKNPPFGFGYQYTRSIHSPWNTLKNSVGCFVRVFDQITIALVVLKILGYFSGGWGMAFMPSIAVAVLRLVANFLDAEQDRLLQETSEERRKRSWERWEAAHPKDLEDAELKSDDEEDGDIW